MALRDFEPKLMWRQFEKILTIPRESGKEEQIIEYVIGEANRFGLEYRQDEIGNVIISKPATPGHESSPGVVLQSHLDMVCEKNSDVDHDFTKDPIQTEIKDGYLTAVGTTLGGDNGIGVAAQLAVLEDKELVHGPLETLFTVDEEAGLGGARALSSGFVKGRTLLNLDSEELEILYVGCAGGMDTNVTFNLPLESCQPATTGLKISVKGLRGGHSGCDIEKFRGNAVKLLTRTLFSLNETFQIGLAELHGGNRRNAIAREAQAVICVTKNNLAAIKQAVTICETWFKDEYGTVEPGLTVTADETDLPPGVFYGANANRLLDFLMAAPHGVAAMSPDIEGLVETSTNMASVKTSNDIVKIQFMTRSSIDSALNMVSGSIAGAARLAGAHFKHSGKYSGWKPNMNSRILNTTARAHENVFGFAPEIKAIHAGLECGIIGQQIPDMDMVSFGPLLENPHSPAEQLQIDSVEKFWKLMAETLRLLAEA